MKLQEEFLQQFFKNNYVEVETEFGWTDMLLEEAIDADEKIWREFPVGVMQYRSVKNKSLVKVVFWKVDENDDRNILVWKRKKEENKWNVHHVGWREVIRNGVRVKEPVSTRNLRELPERVSEFLNGL